MSVKWTGPSTAWPRIRRLLETALMAQLEKCRLGGRVRRQEEREERRREAEAEVGPAEGRMCSPVREAITRFSCSTGAFWAGVLEVVVA
jgi:hypothetical protein